MSVKKEIKKVRMVCAACVGAAILFSAYFAGILQTLFWSYFKVNTINPITIIQNMRSLGFPYIIFCFCMAACMMIISYMYFAMSKKARGVDKLGRDIYIARDSGTYGNVDFEEPEEYEAKALVQDVEHAWGNIFGTIEAGSKNVINARMDGADPTGNRHIMVFGASGSGKTYTYVKNAILQSAKRMESVIVTDPDGGLYRDMAPYLESHGYKVRVINFANFDKSDGWNCLNSIRPEHAETDAQEFAHVVMSNCPDKPEGIYFTAPLALLKALVMRQVLDPRIPPEERNLPCAYDNINRGDPETWLAAIFADHMLTKESLPSQRSYQTFTTASPNLKGNIITNLAVELNLLQVDKIRQMLSVDDIDLEAPSRERCAYFCVFPDNNTTYKMLVSLYFSMQASRLVDAHDQAPEGKKPPIPVNFILDEFPSVGVLPDWDKRMATIRKRNLHVTMIVQSLAQLQNLYLDTWETILSNCATWYILSVNDEVTAEYISNHIGETTVIVRSEKFKSTSDEMMPYHTNTQGEGRRALLTPAEILTLSDDNDKTSILIFQNHGPIIAKPFPITSHPEYKNLGRPYSWEDIPDLSDRKSREERRAVIEKQIQAYRAEHPTEIFDRKYHELDSVKYMQQYKSEVIKYKKKHIEQNTLNGNVTTFTITANKETTDEVPDEKAKEENPEKQTTSGIEDAIKKHIEENAPKVIQGLKGTKVVLTPGIQVNSEEAQTPPDIPVSRDLKDTHKYNTDNSGNNGVNPLKALRMQKKQ